MLFAGGVSGLRASREWQEISLSSSSVFTDMTPLGAECGDIEPFNIAVDEQIRTGFVSQQLHLIHDLLFLPISTIESAVGKRLITHCCVSRLACSRLSGLIEPHSPRLQA